MSKYVYKAFSFKLLLITVLLSSCRSGPFNLFKTSSPHEIYKKKLVNSGLSQTSMVKAWIDLSENILQKPVMITIPYLERGYFSSEKIQATAFSFKMERGHKFQVKLSKKPVSGFRIFADVWEQKQDGEFSIIGSSDTLENTFQSDIEDSGTYILRLQPELLAGGEYTLEITSGPSMGYPLKTYQNNQIRSFFGDGRDADTRKHEGIDIFSSFRTPVIAIAPGMVIRVNENNLGGKVVWLRPEGKDFTLYYAHLDEQTVTDGQMVEAGDILGRMGNTGNARTTPPHLHFGIYTRNGAVNPLPYINPDVPETPRVNAEVNNINSTMRTIGNTSLIGSGSGTTALKNGTVIRINAASANNYRVELPDGSMGYLPGRKVSPVAQPLLRHKIASDQQQMFDRPDTAAAVKLKLETGQSVNVVGDFGNYHLVLTGNESGWIKK